MSAKNPENFSKIVWMRFEIFRDLYVESMAPIGQYVKRLDRSRYIVLDTPSHSAWSESSRSHSVATGHRRERSDRARDTGVRSDSERETDHSYPGNRQ